MDVIGAGFGRTGTLSLKAAIEQLGFGPCAHMVPLIQDQERAALFLRAAEGEPGGLDRAFDGFRSTVDWPGTFFWPELIAKHPQAKVVLSVRDPGKWYESAESTIFQAATAARQAPGGPPPHMAAFVDMVWATVWEGTFKGRFADRDFAIGVFEEHNEAVRRTVPADRLLEFEVKQGWGPLCDFLGRPVPETDFPRLNDAETFRAQTAERHRPAMAQA